MDVQKNDAFAYSCREKKNETKQKTVENTSTARKRKPGGKMSDAVDM